MPSIFVTIIACGAYGGAERQRSGHGEKDGQLFGALGTGLICACLPSMGVFVTIFLGRIGSEKAGYAFYALWGTILGIAIPCLLVLLGFLVSPK